MTASELSGTDGGPSEGIVEELAAGLQAALGTDLVALYLYGSSACGGFDAGVSDIDLLAVTSREVRALDLAAVEAFHQFVVERHPEWDDRLEIVYVGRETLARFREGGSLAVISPGEQFHLRDGVEQWLANFYLVRETGATLHGACSGDVIPTISHDEFLAAIAAYAAEVRGRDIRAASPRERAYGVLTMCRALATLRSGHPCSKQEGAAWVRSRMPEWAWLIDEALLCRLANGRTGFADDGTIAAAEKFIHRLDDEIADIAKR